MPNVPTSIAVNKLVSKWQAKHPELTARLNRAVSLVANVSRGFCPWVYFVEGSDGHSYIVRVNRKEHTSTCTCPDSTERGAHCKHRLAVALFDKGQDTN